MEDANFEFQTANKAILRLTTFVQWVKFMLEDRETLRTGPTDSFWDRAFASMINKCINVRLSLPLGVRLEKEEMAIWLFRSWIGVEPFLRPLFTHPHTPPCNKKPHSLSPPHPALTPPIPVCECRRRTPSMRRPTTAPRSRLATTTSRPLAMCTGRRARRCTWILSSTSSASSACCLRRSARTPPSTSGVSSTYGPF